MITEACWFNLKNSWVDWNIPIIWCENIRIYSNIRFNENIPNMVFEKFEFIKISDMIKFFQMF